MIEITELKFRGKPIIKEDEMITTGTAYFDHLYVTSGFDISKEMITNGKEYKASQRHYCLKNGFWCWSNLLEYPLDLITYLKIKLKIII